MYCPKRNWRGTDVAVRRETQEGEQRRQQTSSLRRQDPRQACKWNWDKESGEAEIGNKVSEVGVRLFMGELGGFEVSGYK